MLRAIVTLICLVAANPAPADWELVKNSSSVSFGTVKNNTVSESHKFTEFGGVVQDNGLARIQIDLLSVDTGIDIRDQRMRNLLFADASTAVYEARIGIPRFTRIPTGESIELILYGSLELNGQSQEMPLDVRMTHLKSGNYLVETISAKTIELGSFGFIPGIEQLRAIAGLNAISTAVTLEFKLVFQRAD